MSAFSTAPLTASQTAIWESHVLSPASPLFNQIVIVKLHGKHHVEALQRAWKTVVSMHPILQSSVVVDDDGCAFLSGSDYDCVLASVDLTSVSNSVSGNWTDWLESRNARPFDLNSILSYAAVVVTGDDEHFFYLKIHHIVADAYSVATIWRDFSTVASGQIAANNPTDFSDYMKSCAILAGRRLVDKQVTSREMTPVFYGEYPSTRGTVSTRYSLTSGQVDLEKLDKLSGEKAFAQLNMNLFRFTVHLTVLVALIHRITNDQRIVVDTPIAGRFDPRWSTCVGNFMEMIRLEVPVSRSDSFTDLYQVCRTEVMRSLRNAAPGCSANLKRRPVHAVLNVVTASGQSINEWSDGMQWLHPGHSDAHHPFRVHVSDWNSSGKPEISVDINAAFFSRKRAIQLISHLEKVYTQISSDRDTVVSKFPLTGIGELWRFSGVTDSANTKSSAGSIEYQAHRSSLPNSSMVGYRNASHGSRVSSHQGQPANVVEAIESICRTNPDVISVSSDSIALSYGDLYSQFHSVRVNLKDLGLTGGERVALFLARSCTLPAVVLGVMNAGAAVVMIDVDQAPNRVADIIQDADVMFTIVDDHNDTARQLSGRVVPLSAVLMEQEPIDLEHTLLDGQNPSSTVIDGDNAAYIMYTSGSTGKPKGVEVSHRALMSYLEWASNFYELSERMVMPFFTSIGFDLTLTSLFLPLLSGGEVRVYGQSRQTANTELYAVFNDNLCTTVKLTPAHLSLVADMDISRSKVRQLIVGGEDLKSHLAQRIVKLFPEPVRLINEYGPTEATVGCVVRDLSQYPVRGSSVPIGLPITGMNAIVLDEERQPQIEGMPGELYLSGSSLATGYWRDQPQTDGAFIQLDLQVEGDAIGDRAYRTGDLVRVIDGELVYLGRLDNQLNFNGHRVEIEEIESAVLDYPGMDECHLLVNKSKGENNVPASFVNQDLRCRQCGLESAYPGSDIDEMGMCCICRNFEPYERKINAYFHSQDRLDALVSKIKNQRTADHDVVVLLSGGKDSTYALCRLVDTGLKVLAFTLDNGYISDTAKRNIEKVCQSLNVDHVYGTTEFMDSIFVDSLQRHSNVCHGCFKTIYSLSLKIASERGIKTIFTGLSRGQLFETRLDNTLFSQQSMDVATIDNMVLAARKTYHSIADAPHKLLAIKSVNDGSLLDSIELIDFYRYHQVEMSEMLSYLESRVGWVRPTDTGRSTNCLINDVGIYVHKLERGFHNYALPYSWDVRLGHKKKEDAIDELDDSINADHVQEVLDSIGYAPAAPMQKVNADMSLYFTADAQVDVDALRNWLGRRLPYYMMPSQFHKVDGIPLNVHGKVDRKVLFDSVAAPGQSRKFREAETPAQKLLEELWVFFLESHQIGLDDNFFESGGDSLAAIRCVMKLKSKGYNVNPIDLFENPTLEAFAARLDVLGKTPEPEKKRFPVGGSKERFSSLSDEQKSRLNSILSKR